MRVGLTGASGFIGGHLVWRLLEDGHEVVSLGRTRPSRAVEHRHYDLAEMAPPPLDGDLDAFVHLAAVVDTDDPPLPAHLTANVGASWILADWSRNHGVRHLHASTGGVYGCGPDPFTESHPLVPVDSYSITKAMAETAVGAVNPEAVMIRYFFPYGPGTPNPIPSMLAGLGEGRPIQARPDGGPRLNPIHVDDAVEATLRLLDDTTTGPLNVAGAEVISFSELATLGARLMGASVGWEPVEAGALHPYYRSDVVGDTTRMEEALGLESFTPLQRGLRELVEQM
ncbi:MAG: NAD-dependent epimerase/dehydratase family protein [Actinomycetota bacterium]